MQRSKERKQGRRITRNKKKVTKRTSAAAVSRIKTKRKKHTKTPKLPKKRIHSTKLNPHKQNIFTTYDDTVLRNKVMLLSNRLESNQDHFSFQEEEDDEFDDDDVKRADIFYKYITKAGGPLFQNGSDFVHTSAMRLMKERKDTLTKEERHLNAERARSAQQCSLSIDPIQIQRKDFLKHNNFNNIPSHPYRCIFTGTTGSGKTTNMVNLLIQPQFLKDYFDKIYIFSPNAKTELEFMEIVRLNRGEVILKEDWDEFEVDDIFKEMIATAKRFKQDRSGMPRCLLFIDDFAGHKHVMNSSLLVKIFFMSRKYSCSTWISSQRYKAVPPNLRTNAEYHVIYEQSSTQTQLIGEELSVGKFTSQRIAEVMDLVSETPYSFLFVNTKKRVNDGRFRFTYNEILT